MVPLTNVVLKCPGACRTLRGDTIPHPSHWLQACVEEGALLAHVVAGRLPRVRGRKSRDLVKVGACRLARIIVW